MTDDAAALPLKKTSLHAAHLEARGKMVPFAGFELPVQYAGAGVVEEHKAVREAAGMFDVSHMGELELRGSGAQKTINALITNDTAKLADGQALYTCACNAGGTILDDLIVYRRSADDWLVVCNASNREKISAHFAAHARDCSFEDASDRTALIALQGPKALEIAAGIGGEALSQLKSFSFTSSNLGGVDCTASRTGYTGEDGLEIFCAWDDAPRLWGAIVESGAPKGLKLAGLAARDTLRLEARLSLYGNDIDETTNPLEAGLGWVVKLDKADFLGKDALVAAKAAGFTRKLVGFEVTGRGIARHGYKLLDASGAEVGICTSGSPGPTVGKNIGLGYLPTAMTAIGTSFVVDCRGKSIEAQVVKTPFYKRAG